MQQDFLWMQYDYREQTRKEIIQRIRKLQGVQLWGSLLKDMGWQGWAALMNPVYMVTVLGQLKSRLDDLLESYVKRVNNCFDMAWGYDYSYSQKGVILDNAGQELLTFLKELTAVATPEGLPGILTNSAFLQHPESGETVFGIPTVITAKEPSISDGELIALAPSMSSNGFRNSLACAEGAVARMGIGTVFLIALFKHKDVIKDSVLYERDIGTVLGYVRKMILRGEGGFDSLESIAAELGISVEDARYILQNGKLPPQTFGADTAPGVWDGSEILDNAQVMQKLDTILRRNLDGALADEESFKKLCQEAGMTEDIFQAAVNGEFSGYSYALYKKEIAATVAKLCEQQDFKIYPSKVKSIVDQLKAAYSLENSGEKGKQLKKMLENDLSDEEEIRSFLKEYCGFDSVSTQDLQTFRDATFFMKGLKSGSKVLANTEKVIDKFIKWTADYEGQLEAVNHLIELGGGSPEYQAALLDLKNEYSSRFRMIATDVTDMLIDKGIDAAIDAFKPLGLAETALSMAGKITGASGYADAASKTLVLQGISSTAVNNYEAALAVLQGGDTSAGALQNVRSTFTFAQQTLKDYYGAQVELYRSGVGEFKDPSMAAYLEHEAYRIKNLKLGDVFEAMDYDTYVAQYGG